MVDETLMTGGDSFAAIGNSARVDTLAEGLAEMGHERESSSPG